MKIGILTFHYSANFGANLQSLATQSILKKSGVQPIILDYRSPAKVEAIQRLVSEEQLQQHAEFIDKYLNTSPRFNNEDDLACFCCSELDVVIVGSDAVFRLGEGNNPKRILKKILGRDHGYLTFASDSDIPPYFLNWMKNDGRPIKASLAPSSRFTKFWLLKPSIYRQVGRSLRDFDLITVRDNWTQTLVHWMTFGTKSAELCPDPLFALNDHYDVPALDSSLGDLSRTVLVSGHYPDYWMDALQKELRLRDYRMATFPNSVTNFIYENADQNITLPMSPFDWYGAIAQCAGYIGGRIHAIIAAIENRTPFICVDILKPLFADHVAQDAYYDLQMKSGTIERYFLFRDLIKQDAKCIVDLLFCDDETQAASDDYAIVASTQVKNTVNKIITLAQQ